VQIKLKIGESLKNRDNNRTIVMGEVPVKEEEVPFFAEVTAGGRITIPEEIRKIFDIRDGDYLLCRIKIVKRRVRD
jgi:hypothetical protein